MRTLHDRVAVVTGAGSGIGRALATALARKGCHLALVDVNATGLAAAERDVVALGRRVSTHVADRAAMEALPATVLAVHGHVHVLVNNAGVALDGTFEDVALDDVAWLFGVNVWGVVHGCKVFLPLLRREPEAHVVNVSSVFGLTTSVGVGAYAASKFAVRGYTETLAVEMLVLGLPIFVTSVHPGGIKTPLVRNGRVRGHSTLAGSPAQVADEFERNLARTSAETCARRIAQVLIKPKRRLLVGLDAHLIDWGVRLLPSMHQSILARALRRTFSTR
jgi:NAD(P)-dependent dehydrogenase (short-subunit alcohol dehydrogenase family)